MDSPSGKKNTNDGKTMENLTSVENQNKSEESKPNFLLSWLGDKGKHDLKWDTWDEDDRKDAKEICRRLNDLIQPPEKYTEINFRL